MGFHKLKFTPLQTETPTLVYPFGKSSPLLASNNLTSDDSTFKKQKHFSTFLNRRIAAQVCCSLPRAPFLLTP